MLNLTRRIFRNDGVAAAAAAAAVVADDIVAVVIFDVIFFAVDGTGIGAIDARFLDMA